MRLSKEACLLLGKAYVEKYNKYPTAKPWTIATAGCSRDRIYENWSGWTAFISDLKSIVSVPVPKKVISLNTTKPCWSVESILACLHQSASVNTYPKYSEFLRNPEYPSISTIRKYFGSWKAAVQAAGLMREKLPHKNYDLYSSLDKAFTESKYHIPSNSKGMTKEILLTAICDNSIVHNKYGYSKSGWTKFIRKVFPDKTDTASYKGFLLNKLNLSYCGNCNKVLSTSAFWKNNSLYGRNSYCIDCMSIYNRLARPSINARRRAAELKALPSWADKKAIAHFYSRCPTGHQVDHIIPLQGKYVCGLHTLENLQYMLASTNNSKSNYHESEEYWK